jgi:hypothetical protein
MDRGAAKAHRSCALQPVAGTKPHRGCIKSERRWWRLSPRVGRCAGDGPVMMDRSSSKLELGVKRFEARGGEVKGGTSHGEEQ